MKDYERCRALILQPVTPSIHLCAFVKLWFLLLSRPEFCERLLAFVWLEIDNDGNGEHEFRFLSFILKFVCKFFWRLFFITSFISQLWQNQQLLRTLWHFSMQSHQLTSIGHKNEAIIVYEECTIVIARRTRNEIR